MERNYEQEMDALREQMETLQQTVFSQLNALQAAVAELLPGKPSAEQGEHVHVMKNMHPDSRLSALMEELCEKTGQEQGSVLVSYLGVYHSVCR